MKNNKLSVVLATKNEEVNIGPCLESVKDIASEIIVYDEFSSDKTREIARKHGAKVYKYKHKTNFHQTKQKAIDKAKGDWILQLDADERLSSRLAKEIKGVTNSPNDELLKRVLVSGGDVSYQPSTINHSKVKLFRRHQHLIQEREGKLGKSTGEVVAFFIPRRNYFLGASLIHAGVYPDGVIRLFKRGRARLPAKSVHEVMEVDGEIGWLTNDLEHHESPTFDRYLRRWNFYTDLIAKDFAKQSVPVNPIFLILYSTFKPLFCFLNLYIRHKGFLDGMRGFAWSLFSALRFPVSYFKYYQKVKQ